MSRNEQKQGSLERRARKGRGMPPGPAKEASGHATVKLENITFTDEHVVMRVDLSDKEVRQMFTSFAQEEDPGNVRVVFEGRKGRFEVINMGNDALKVRGKRKRISKHLNLRSGTSQARLPDTRKPTAFETAMSNARKRGSLRVGEILSGDDMLSGEEFGNRLGLTRQAIDARRKNGQLIGLEGPGRGVHYPEWQIMSDGHLTPGISEILELVDGDTWAAYRFLVEDFPDASRDRLVDKLQDGEVDLVLNHIETVLRGGYT